ncbi:biopolymer transporter ExbD [Desertifilum sp. FACHB-1129]|uniref:Biopolymer transporter ExbD n=2 Tax=Desertifilum tharense IPPAS B-1220 TaxID=1781255 RepID=A0A1E5QFC9_9CYAN|nr:MULTISPECIES: biopolymer transporter ExbD [Desertifilum]MDA0213415.1 biopolymer transporter ExbD [Cyanobacteria bacterium FC1]MBD2314902.1 biopolymer transporter ExbD [Desertifilum sp. FACHB-1129]MBD2322896.1 biopolymer transporter ExbD [Desertifilum sp. FACHB-866]MBD2335291.1 biopolymer transporter ExbD [Desertifilum sp. FACHB-868]OEJ73043.1 biopolymer transporter ExbD [Desertifilum tharense IPPAS B-1220]
MKIQDDEPESAYSINIVPMIDVIFAILAFFVISTLFLTRSEGLPVNLPEAMTGVSQRQQQIIVTIDPQGGLALNRQPIELNGLVAEVERLVVNNQVSVVLNADESVSHGRVVAVMDRLREIEGVRLAIATTRP